MRRSSMIHETFREETMSRNIPFFEMFAELQLSGELRLKLAGAELTGACIDQAAMTIKLLLTVKSVLSGEDLQSVKDAIRTVYGFTGVDIDPAEASRWWVRS